MTSPMFSRPKSARCGRGRTSRAWATIASACRQPRAQPAEHHTAEDHLLDHRGDDDGGDGEGGDRRAVASTAAAAGVEVAAVGHAEHPDQLHDDADAERRRQPDQRTPPEVDPAHAHPEVAQRTPGAVPPAGEHAPQRSTARSRRAPRRPCSTKMFHRSSIDEMTARLAISDAASMTVAPRAVTIGSTGCSSTGAAGGVRAAVWCVHRWPSNQRSRPGR